MSRPHVRTLLSSSHVEEEKGVEDNEPNGDIDSTEVNEYRGPLYVRQFFQHDRDDGRGNCAKATSFFQCLVCYVVGITVISLCVYLMYKVLSTIQWSSLT